MVNLIFLATRDLGRLHNMVHPMYSMYQPEVIT